MNNNNENTTNVGEGWEFLDEQWYYNRKSNLYYNTFNNQYYSDLSKQNFSNLEIEKCDDQTILQVDHQEKNNVFDVEQEIGRQSINGNHAEVQITAGARFMQGRRVKQEDRHVCIDNLYDLMDHEQSTNFFQLFRCSRASFYGLFDGHSGTLASEFCALVVHKNIIAFLLKLAISDDAPGKECERNIIQSSPITSAQCISTNSETDNSFSSTITASSCSFNSTNSSSYSNPTSTFKDITSPISECSTSVTSVSLYSSSNSVSVGPAVSNECLPGVSLNNDDLMLRTSNEDNTSVTPCEIIGNVPIQKIEETIKCAFHHTDRQFLQKYRLARDGCTAVICLVLGKYIFVAWLGDSRALIGQSCYEQSSGKYEIRGTRLTDDHKPSRQDEKERIEKAGGKIVYVHGIARVATSDYEAKAKRIKLETCLHGAAAIRPPVLLAVSRALGDREFKEDPLLISTPEIVTRKLTNNDKFVVMACDGIWDVMTDDEVIETVNSYFGNPAEASSAIVKTAFNKKSQDNLTAVVLFFENLTGD